MPIADVELTLREARDEAEGTRSFLFDARGLAGVRAGQYLLVKLDAPDDPRRGSRSFTIASAPSEPHVMITTRMRDGSPFKRRLAEMRSGDRLAAKGPLGRFVLHDGDAPALLLAGGIGVTPFRAMIREAIHAGRRGPITLLTSDRTPAAIPFRREMEEWASPTRGIRIERTVTRPIEAGTWGGHRGRIDATWVRAAAGGLERAIAYVAGPPAFVAAATAVVGSVGVPKERLVSEVFIGY
jgi:ferredoxin-NADP reductase